MTPTEQAAVACILTCLAGLCLGAAWARWHVRRHTPAVVADPDAEWAALLAAVTPLVHAPGPRPIGPTLCGTAPVVGDPVVTSTWGPEVDCAVCVDLLAVGSES